MEPNTFWQDFTIADHFGLKAVQDTFNRAFKEWKGDYKMLTALVVTLNHKIWQHYENMEKAPASKEFMELYNNLWEQADAYACDNLTGEELTYFYEITD